MISIAGRAVAVGDALYHTNLRMWGVVNRYDTGAAVLRFDLPDSRFREVHIQQGGVSQGIRVAYWHAPLELDLPSANVVRYQNIVNHLISEGF